jgi:hypothetical protein
MSAYAKAFVIANGGHIAAFSEGADPSAREGVRNESAG